MSHNPTCLPWQTKQDFDTEGATTIIGNVDGEIIDGTTHHTYDFVARTLDIEDDSQSRSVAIANANFIVRACNSHAALLEALEFYADESAWNQPPVKTVPHELLGTAYENQASKVRWDRGRIARAAINLARGAQ